MSSGILAPLKGKHVASALQFNRPMVEALITLAGKLKVDVETEAPTPAGEIATCNLLNGKVMAPLFFENSSRTFCSFVAAMQRLGGGIVHVPIEHSSVSKGESLSDTVRTLDQYADVLVLRHPKQEALEEATAVAEHPIMNAGNGTGEHPTQALLDAFTIFSELGALDGLSIALVGDLKNGRTVHSLVKLLINFDIKQFYFVSPAALKMPQDVADVATARGIQVHYAEDISKVIADVDVVYTTRTQKERFASEEEYNAVKGTYTINAEVMKLAKQKMIVMHPLPRNDELATDVDTDPRAAYFRQMRCGLYMRMGLLLAALGKIPPRWQA